MTAGPLTPPRGPSTAGLIRPSAPRAALTRELHALAAAGVRPPCVESPNRDAWTSDDLDELEAAAQVCRRGGCPVLDLCAAAGRGEKAGVWGGMIRTRPMPPQLLAQRLRRKGLTYRQIAADLGVTATTARAWAPDPPHVREARRTRAARVRAEGLRLRADGLSLRAIATALGVDHSTVWAWTREPA